MHDPTLLPTPTARPSPRSPLESLAPIEAPNGALRIRERRMTGKINLRGDASDRTFLAAVGSALGLVLPTEPNTASGTEQVAALWLGPDEWLIATEREDRFTILAALHEALADPAMGHRSGAVTDVTDSRTVIAIEGAFARDILAKGCALDMHHTTFHAGQVMQTSFGKALVAIHARAGTLAGGWSGTGSPPAVFANPDNTRFDLYVLRSFAPYLWALAADASALIVHTASHTAEGRA